MYTIVKTNFVFTNALYKDELSPQACTDKLPLGFAYSCMALAYANAFVERKGSLLEIMRSKLTIFHIILFVPYIYVHHQHDKYTTTLVHLVVLDEKETK